MFMNRILHRKTKPPSWAARGTSVCPACTGPGRGSSRVPAQPTGLCTTRHTDEPLVHWERDKGHRVHGQNLTLSLK